MTTTMAKPPQFQKSHQELSLYSHIPASRQPAILRIISGIAGMLPTDTLHHHLVFKPKRPKQIGPGNGGELYYVQLVSKVEEEEEGGGIKDGKYELRKQKWKMTLEDIPESPRKPVTSRSVLSSNITEGDALAFMESLGYTFQSTYFTRSSQLIHNNVIIKLFQVLLQPSTPSQAAAPDAMFGNPYPTSSLATLDPAKSWILKASVRVQSNQDVESLNTGVNELKGFKELLKGMCDLEVVERLALDTRIR